MSSIKLIVIAPGNAQMTEVSDAGVVDVPIRKAMRFDELAEALNKRLAVPVLVDEYDAPEPRDGMLVICRPDVLFKLEKAQSIDFSWVVAVDLIRVDAVKRAERLGLAASIEVCDYWNWLESSLVPAAIFGRKELAPRIGATVDTNPLQSSLRYVRMTWTEGDLPRLLGDYLAAYEEVMLARI